MNFSIDEFLKSVTAEKYNISNKPVDYKVYENIMRLVVDILQPLRNYIQKPIIINSGFRVSSLNILLRGVHNSQHLTGNAVDISCPDYNCKDLAQIILKMNLPYDQMLVYVKRNFIHISLKESNNRKEFKYV